MMLNGVIFFVAIFLELIVIGSVLENRLIEIRDELRKRGI